MQQDVDAVEVVAGGEVSTGGTAGFSTGYRTYVLVLVTLVYVVNYLDRQILGILNPQIKAEFHVSNFEIGLLNGPVFAAMYATLGIPIAVLADRVNRRNVIAISMTIFSVMTLLGAYAAQFWQLMLTRFGTGIGEAGTGPSINSVLADLYPPHKRASALAFYSAGLNVGLLIAFFGGGWIAQHYGWRVALRTAGLPGIALAVLLLATVREPKRGQVEKLPDKADTPNLWAVVRYLWGQKSFRWMAFGTAMSSFGGYANIAFLPQFLVVSHHMTLPAIGLASDTTTALTAAAMPSLVGAAFIGPAYAMSQALVPLRMRARSAAILLFVLNIIALGTAAPIVGFISDILEPTFGQDALRYALMTGMITATIGAFCYWQASKTLKSDIARVNEA
jgi:MFS family permease